MIRTDHTIMTVLAGQEGTINVLQGTTDKPRHIKRLIVTPTANAAVVAYFDTDRISLIDSFILPALAPFVDIEADLPAGVALNIGVRDLAFAGIANFRIGYQWEE